MQFKKIWIFIPLILLYGCGGGDSSGSSSSFNEGNGNPVLNNIEVENTASENLIIPIDGKDMTILIKENTRDAFTLKATDKTNLTYYLTGKDIKDLGIDPKTGFVFFNVPTDYETKSKYEIYVGARDSVNKETEQKIIITVEDIKNEQAPIIPIEVKNSLTEDEEKYFITTWKTDNVGISNDNQIIIPTVGDGYNYSVDWGDGTSSKNLTLDGKHTYAKAGTYIIKIIGAFPRIYFGKNVDYNLDTFENDSRKILSIDQWGTNEWESMGGAFTECTYIEGKATDKPNLSKVKDMSTMFAVSAFNQNINDWDISNVENLKLMFFFSSFNHNIANWNTSNVTDMSALFGLSKFNQNIGNWDTSKVENMGGMFMLNPNFNQNIADWDTSNVTEMSLMFFSSTAFNQNILQWDTFKVKDMLSMFQGASSFNQNLEGWNISTEVDTSNIFTRADALSLIPSWYNIDKDMIQRQFIVIAKNTSVESCKVVNFIENIQGAKFGDALEFYQNINKATVISSSKQANSFCSDYARVDDGEKCVSIDAQELQGVSCIIGFDFLEDE
ncbi:MAG: Chitinase (EC [uncultured Sulfurovum sp.]|uniref:Chitinase (EC) n=1 Tax=uncultured Sulfurovum sp. TaxID=269237 RepID=A0A6S6SWR1_9BACT|nr:MAG: Chitinase (EC [uncultured Sulfurovum sp.]